MNKKLIASFAIAATTIILICCVAILFRPQVGRYQYHRSSNESGITITIFDTASGMAKSYITTIPSADVIKYCSENSLPLPRVYNPAVVTFNYADMRPQRTELND